MSKNLREPMFFRCRQCGQSMDDEESIWMLEVKWPAKVKFRKDGRVAYMLADMDDADVMQRFDLQEVICDVCQSPDIEVKEWETEEPWMKAAQEKAAKEKKDKEKE